MAELNPYQAPQAQPDPSRMPRRRPLATLLRAAAVVAGFTLLADPFLAAAARSPVRIGAKFLGAGLMFAAFVPFGRLDPPADGRGTTVEEL